MAITSIGELRCKEVISVIDGSRYGYVNDLEVDLDSGRVRTLVVPGRRRWFGLLGREPSHFIPWTAVSRFGEDTILVDMAGRISDISQFHSTVRPKEPQEFVGNRTLKDG